MALKAREAELLGLLAERRPRTVAKDELIERLWGGAATDAALAQTVYRLRQKLENFTEDCRFIRTIPGVGFQFTGDSPFELRNEQVEMLAPGFPSYQAAVAEYRRRSRSSITSAIRSLEDLKALHPQFLPTTVTLARAYTVAGIRLFCDPQESYWKARRAVKQLLDNDSESAEAYATLAILLLFYDGDREQAHRITEHALRLRPHSLFARKAAFWDRLSYRDLSGALTQADLLVHSTPASGQSMALMGTALYMSRRYDDALRCFDIALSLDSQNGMALYYAISTALLIEDYDEAERLLSNVDQSSTGALALDGLRGVLAARRGDFDRLLEIVSRLESSSIPARMALCAIATAQEKFTWALSLVDDASKTREPSQFLLSLDPLYAQLLKAHPSLEIRLTLEGAYPPKCARCGKVLLRGDEDEACDYVLCSAC